MFGQGYDLGASQFGGDGFVPSPQPANVSGLGAGRADKKKENDNLRNVTVSQLKKQNPAGTEDWQVDGVPLQTCTLVGRITKVQKQATFFLYHVHDGTGEILVLEYHRDEDESQIQQQEALLQPNTYVRVYGHPSQMDGQLRIKAYASKPIKDFNEITFHNLQVIFQRLHLTQGPPPAAGPGGMQPGMAASMARPAGPPITSAPGPGAAQAVQAAPLGAVTGNLLTDLIAVLTAQDAVTAISGLHVNEVFERLKATGAKYTLTQVREGLVMASDEGHCFTTGEEQYKVVPSNN